MKVYLLMGVNAKATFRSPAEVRAVYADRKAAHDAEKRLSLSPYARGQYWVETRTVKENT